MPSATSPRRNSSSSRTATCEKHKNPNYFFIKTDRLTYPLSTKALQSVFETVKTDIRLTSFSSRRFFCPRAEPQRTPRARRVIIFLRDKRVLGVFIFLGENSVPSATLREKKTNWLCARGEAVAEQIL
jgi:hypothetical protein